MSKHVTPSVTLRAHPNMRLFSILLLALSHLASAGVPVDHQVPLLQHANTNRTVSADLFTELEELARVVDITYCVGLTGLGISENTVKFHVAKIFRKLGVASRAEATAFVLAHRPASR